MRPIGDPLVWRHRWCPEQQKVIHQYKYALSDEATFLRDEWGPWLKVEVTCNDDYTGELCKKEVLRSDPKGVELVQSYPDIKDFPGMEEWLDMETWKANQVFSHLQKWKFHRDSCAALASWDELNTWHKAHQNSNEDIDLGEPINLPSASFSTTPLSWTQMWDIILHDVRQDELSSKPGGSSKKEGCTKAGNSTAQKKTKAKFLHPRERLDREALSRSTNLVELNRVTNPNWTEKQQRAAIACDRSHGESYLNDNFEKAGALFLIKLAHYEGEFNVGLGRRTFNDQMDCPNESTYEVQWFERKSKKRCSWGTKPTFQFSKVACVGPKRMMHELTLESKDDFLPIAVDVTKSSKGTDCPQLNQATMEGLRSYMRTATSSSSKDKTAQAGNQPETRKGNSKRVIQSDSDSDHVPSPSNSSSSSSSSVRSDMMIESIVIKSKAKRGKQHTLRK